MSKRRMLILITILFNVLVSFGFIFSNMYLEDFLDAEINESTTASHIFIEPFRVGVSHPVYIDGTIWNLGPLPTYTTNFPFILFWVSTLGNVTLLTLIIKTERQKGNLEEMKA